MRTARVPLFERGEARASFLIRLLRANQQHDGEGINLEETRDFMPQMGLMVGYAVTLVIEPSNPAHVAPKRIIRQPPHAAQALPNSACCARGARRRCSG